MSTNNATSTEQPDDDERTTLQDALASTRPVVIIARESMALADEVLRAIERNGKALAVLCGLDFRALAKAAGGYLLVRDIVDWRRKDVIELRNAWRAMQERHRPTVLFLRPTEHRDIADAMVKAWFVD